MDTRTRTRTVVAVVAALLALGLGGLGLAAAYGLALEYGAGLFPQIAIFVVLVPLVPLVVALLVWPGLRSATRWAVVGVFAAVLVGGGFAADALGGRERDERMLADSETFACNGPNAAVEVPAVIDETWQELPREAPVYGPIEGSRTDCVAGVSGDGEQTFADYTDAFRDLEGWQVRTDQPQRFVMTRDDVEVTVRMMGAPDRLTTIEVGVRR